MRPASLRASLNIWFSATNGRGQQAARIAGATLIVIGGMVLSAWKLEIDWLQGAVSGTVTMKANTALGFLLAGVSLSARSRPNSARIAAGSALMIIAIGGLTLCQYFWGWDLGIDQLLVLDRSTPVSPHPGRMGDNTALNFVLVGLALWLMGRRIRHSEALAQLTILCASAIALLALIGYAYQVEGFYRFFLYSTSMAVSTALAFLMLCAGVLALRADRGFMRVLTQPLIGSLTAQRLIPMAIGVPSILGWLILQGLRAQLYSGAFALALLVVALIINFVAIIWKSADRLNSIERDRIRSDDRMRSLQDRLQLALEGAEQGTWDWHIATQALTWDKTCKQMFGLPAGAPVTYEWFLSVLHPDDRQSVAAAVTAALGDRTMFAKEYRTFHPNGTMRWILARGRGSYDSAGQPCRMSGTVLDITDRKQTEGLLAAQTEELIRTSRLKDEFLAALSHELRTPLNPILGWTSMMKAQRLTPQQTADALETIDRNVRQQIRLVDDLLDVSHVIQGKLKLEFCQTDLAIVLQDAIATVQFAAQAKNIGLELKGLTSLPLLADRDRLQQVFWNLLSNAIKFTPTGGRVKIELSMNTNLQAQVRVTDSGSGIEPDFLPHVFDRFRQADSSNTRKYGGLGLGLSIVQQLVELHGGKVAVESPGTDQGTTFTVQLPIPTEAEYLSETITAATMAKHPESIPAVEHSSPPSLTGVRILAIDDEPDNLDLLHFLLQQEGAIVTSTCSPLNAIDLVASQTFDLIISDIGMPELNGYELMQHIRALPQAQTVPALALTAFAYSENQNQAIAAGFQAQLTKPVNPIELLEVVAQLVHR
jgi:PAS domain S-box-containing protein